MKKHYIEIDSDKYITKAFSSDFGKPGPNSICVNENAPRHFHLQLRNREGLLIKKYVKGEIVDANPKLADLRDLLKKQADAEFLRRKNNYYTMEQRVDVLIEGDKLEQQKMKERFNNLNQKRESLKKEIDLKNSKTLLKFRVSDDIYWS